VPHADANGQRLYYEEHGEGEPLILVMGLSGDHVAWTLQVHEFAKRFRVISFDNRDVGQSSLADGDYEVADMAADTLALADVLEIDSFHLVGMSLGGAIAQEVALTAPERIRTLTLAVTYGGSAVGELRTRTWGAQALRASREEHVDELMLRGYSEQFFENERAARHMRQLILDNPYPQPPEAFVRQLGASGRHETRDRLGDLSMPVHVIAAEHDWQVPRWKSDELAELIPGAEFTVLERAPHLANVERAEDFNRAVLDFIAARVEG
jgi:pimeloyl-ACP methyl ester carboxylesterase